MASTATCTKPSKIAVVHARANNNGGGHYHRFEPGQASTALQDQSNDNGVFATTSITFSAGSGTITPTLPTGMAAAHVVMTNGHYYRFETSGQVTALQNGDATGDFATISFTTA